MVVGGRSIILLPVSGRIIDYPASVSVQGETAAVRLRMRTRLYAAAVRVNTQATRSVPRCRVFLKLPTVFIQPKTSSTRWRRR